MLHTCECNMRASKVHSMLAWCKQIYARKCVQIASMQGDDVWHPRCEHVSAPVQTKADDEIEVGRGTPTPSQGNAPNQE